MACTVGWPREEEKAISYLHQAPCPNRQGKPPMHTPRSRHMAAACPPVRFDMSSTANNTEALFSCTRRLFFDCNRLAPVVTVVCCWLPRQGLGRDKGFRLDLTARLPFPQLVLRARALASATSLPQAGTTVERQGRPSAWIHTPSSSVF